MTLSRNGDSQSTIHHSDVNRGTLYRYANRLAGILILALRNHHRPNPLYHFDLPADIKLAIDSFTQHYANSTVTTALPPFTQDPEYSAEEGGNEDNQEEEEMATCLTHESYTEETQVTAQPLQQSPPIEDHLHKLLFALYSQLPESVDGGSFYSPILRWIVLGSLKTNGTWAKTGDISQLIATALFCGRLVMYHEVDITLDPGSYQNFHE